MIAARLNVAIRLRHARKRGAVDSYHLAMRLRGMGYEHLLNVPLAVLAGEAMIEFILRDPELGRGVRQMVCVGTSSAEERAYLTREAAVPVEFVADVADCRELSNALLFVRGDADAARRLDSVDASRRNVRVVHERDLAAKFAA
jgi:hypothetical protein